MKVKGCRDTKLSGVIPVEGTEPTTRVRELELGKLTRDVRTYKQWWEGLPDVRSCCQGFVEPHCVNKNLYFG